MSDLDLIDAALTVIGVVLLMLGFVIFMASLLP